MSFALQYNCIVYDDELLYAKVHKNILFCLLTQDEIVPFALIVKVFIPGSSALKYILRIVTKKSANVYA